MADSKITALTALTAADPANDMIPIVDVSDTPPASGNTKRISINNILACSPSATLASATITGDLTVRTNKLAVTSTGVGAGTATPLYPLHLVGEFGLEEASPAGTGSKLRFIGDATKYNFRIGKQLNVSNGFEITPSTTVGGTTFSNPVYTVTNDGIHTFLDGAGGTRMTLNSTGLGVGVTPGSGKIAARAGTAATGNSLYADNIDGTYNPWIQIQHSSAGIKIFNSSSFGGSSNNLIFGNGTTSETMRIDSTGNVGIGVTPSAWTLGKSLQVNGAAITSTGQEIYLTANGYYGSGAWTYKNTDYASQYYQLNGKHVWRTAASGTAGNSITFVDFMQLDASGNLILLSSNTPATLTTNGQLTVNATSNTNLRFSYRGSDGITRVANLTLA